MSAPAARTFRRICHQLLPAVHLLLPSTVVMLIGGLLLPGLVLSSAMLLASAMLCVITLAVVLSGRQQRAVQALSGVVELADADPTPVLLCDSDGAVRHINPAARRDFSQPEAATLAEALRGQLYDARALVRRLQKKAAKQGAAREDAFGPAGRMQLTAQALPGAHYLWRCEAFADVPERDVDPSIPQITIGRAGSISHMNEAAVALAGGVRGGWRNCWGRKASALARWSNSKRRGAGSDGGWRM